MKETQKYRGITLVGPPGDDNFGVLKNFVSHIKLMCLLH